MNTLRSIWITLQKEWILWRTQCVLKQIDKKLALHAQYLQALKKNQEQEK